MQKRADKKLTFKVLKVAEHQQTQYYFSTEPIHVPRVSRKLFIYIFFFFTKSRLYY
jgi:hypothetical protein